MNVKEKLQLLTDGVVLEKGVIVKIDLVYPHDYSEEGFKSIYGLVTGVTDNRLYIDVGMPQQESPSLGINHDDISNITFILLSKFALILNALR